jgi:hypothetical protein
MTSEYKIPGISVSDHDESMQMDDAVQPIVTQEENVHPGNFQSEETTAGENSPYLKARKQQRNKTNNPARERIQRLLNENHAKDQMNMQLQSELAEKERILFQKEEELRNREANSHQLFENNLRQEENAIVQGLKLAKESGDIDTEVELQRDLARVKSEQSAFDVLKVQNQTVPQDFSDVSDTTFYPNTNPYDYGFVNQENLYDEPEVSDDFAYFTERNPWINRNAPEFSPELAQEADFIAAELNKRLKFNNMAHFIGTPEYYEEIEKAMHNNYGVREQERAQNQVVPQYHYSQPNPQAHRYQTSGVSRQGATLADQYVSRASPNSMNAAPSLSADEYKIARNLMIPTNAGGNDQFSSDQAINMYVKYKNMLKKQNNDQNFRISIE